MATRVHVLGSYHSDFARNVSKDSAEPLFDLLNEAAHGCLADAAVAAEDVQTAHVANLAAELFTGQAHLGAMVPALDPAWTSLPTSRHEAACASGSVAVLAAMAEIEAGRYEVALVLGVELMRGVDGVSAVQHLGCAAWLGRDEFGNELPWPWAFDRIAEEVEARSGLDRSHLARIAEINRANARRNPLAQTRAWTSNPGDYADDDVSNPVVSGRTRRSDCGRITDGSAAVLLAGERYAAEWARRRNRSQPAHISGWGHRTGTLSLADKLAASEGQPYLLPHLRATITDAYRRAGISGQAVESGLIEADGDLPVNPSGGLIGLGHPVGATGVRMLGDAARQVTGQAGPVQVPGAQRMATLNIGGSAATAVSFVVSA